MGNDYGMTTKLLNKIKFPKHNHKFKRIFLENSIYEKGKGYYNLDFHSLDYNFFHFVFRYFF